MKRSELITYLDGYLQIAAIKDYGPQGLQVEGREQVNKVVGMVDAQLPCLEAALAHGADMLLVHHGIFWGPPLLLAGVANTVYCSGRRWSRLPIQAKRTHPITADFARLPYPSAVALNFFRVFGHVFFGGAYRTMPRSTTPESATPSLAAKCV